MDRAGEKASPLSADELKVIFDAVAQGELQEKARERLSGRARNTVNRAYNVAAGFAGRNLAEINDKTAAEIAGAAKYSTTVSYVQGLFMR